MNGKLRLEEILENLGGVTKGPWSIMEQSKTPPILSVHGPSEIVCGTDGICEAERYNDRPFVEDAANMRHISRCSPDAFLSITKYVRGLETKLEAADIALEKIADLTARCEHDGGFDRETGPIGCNLGDKCLCIGLHPIARDTLSQLRTAHDKD